MSKWSCQDECSHNEQATIFGPDNTVWSRCCGSVVACPVLAIADAIAIVGGCGPAGASVRLGLLPGGQAEAGPAVPQHQRSHTGTTSEAEE